LTLRAPGHAGVVVEGSVCKGTP